MSTILAIVITMAFASQASAQGAVEIGGRTAITGNFSVISSNPDVGGDTTAVLVGGTVTRTTANARFEYGGGLFLVAALADAGDITIVTPSLQARINSNLLGPEENILVYGGALIGITFVDTDFGSDTLGAFGPKGGVEYYFSSNVAAQLEDLLIFDSDGGVTNNLTLGIKFVF